MVRRGSALNWARLLDYVGGRVPIPMIERWNA